MSTITYESAGATADTPKELRAKLLDSKVYNETDKIPAQRVTREDIII